MPEDWSLENKLLRQTKSKALPKSMKHESMGFFKRLTYFLIKVLKMNKLSAVLIQIEHY